ncbi:hypothetical protein DM02DRAFT_616936 [Periconia macrospinosa]|uniref:Uncharacterized protein n=1 Tax=Periconia macrospinosa TaxID=97972 RepID=A0A2V1DF96_9PLEO|nr:hypothetical protein DM02DRAFT_616936 [Periconia macrospinosa]
MYGIVYGNDTGSGGDETALVAFLRREERNQNLPPCPQRCCTSRPRYAPKPFYISLPG